MEEAVAGVRGQPDSNWCLALRHQPSSCLFVSCIKRSNNIALTKISALGDAHPINRVVLARHSNCYTLFQLLRLQNGRHQGINSQPKCEQSRCSCFTSHSSSGVVLLDKSPGRERRWTL
ncbi:hypothetical protein J6590_020799 [Homalodisca vitripennis]|nr:hypothetical protein J6590_020799 [Homalodisca vitripennis]